MKNEKKLNSKWLILSGTIVAWVIMALSAFLICWAYDAMLSGNKSWLINWVFTGLIVLVLNIYSYGILGLWMMEFDFFAVNRLLVIIGKITGYIGFVLRPFVLLAYGSNKKWILILTTAVPWIIGGVILIILNPFGGFGLPIGIVSIASSLFVFGIKKCKNCKCVMCRIDLDEVKRDDSEYQVKHIDQVGYIEDVGNLYAKYTTNEKGYKIRYAKSYTCDNCGNVKYGIKFNAKTKL